MGRYISMFFLTVFVGILLMFLIPLVFGNLVEVDVVLCILFIIFGSFIITQIFYIIDLVKKGRK